MHGEVRCTDLKEEAKVTMNKDESFLSESQRRTASSVIQESSVTRKLQRNVDALDALGFTVQPWKSSDANQVIDLPVLDVEWLIAQPSLPYLIQVLPTQMLHRSLHDQGLDDALEVIECIRGDALVRLLDYELWTSKEGSTGFLTSDEDISADRFLQWVKLWNEISPDFASERLMELDEGAIVGCLTALCEIVPVGLNRQQEELSDDYWMTPDNKFGLKIKTEGTSDFEVMHAFIHSLYKRDILTAQHVLAHSAMMLRDEALEEARRWRQGRLEDQGFVLGDEARALLAPKTHTQVVELIATALKTQQDLQRAQPSLSTNSMMIYETGLPEVDAFDRVREYIRTIDAEVLRYEIERTLGNEELLQLVGNAQVQTEQLIRDEDVVDCFIQKVTADAKALLMRLEVHNVKASRLHARPSELLIDSVITKLSEADPSEAISWKTRLARVTNCVSSALGVAGEPSELGRMLASMRGCLNLGLENIVKKPENYGIASEKMEEESQFGGKDRDLAYAIARAVGPEALFHVGWQILQQLASEALGKTIAMLEKTHQNGAEVSDKYSIQLSDGERVSLSVLQLLRRGRYLEVRKWLRQALTDSDPAVQHVLLSTVNRLPLFPIILKEEDGALKGGVEVKPYETTHEVEITRIFLANMASISDRISQGE